MISKFVIDYPDLVVAFVSLLFVMLGALLGLWLRSMKSEHAVRAESIIWPKIDERFNSLGEQIHKVELEVVNVTTRLEMLENKMPNGDIKEIKDIVLELLNRK